jgi:hypothetical protein
LATPDANAGSFNACGRPSSRASQGLKLAHRAIEFVARGIAARLPLQMVQRDAVIAGEWHGF